MRKTGLTCLAVLALAGSAYADITIPGADGADGAFEPTSDVEIDLSLATTASWDTPSPDPGAGVYDPEKWAVVFKYTTVNIPAGVTVTFRNHPTRASVVWLVQGDVTISGTIDLRGATGHSRLEIRSLAEPGPGGFRGGHGANISTSASTGLGPGGAALGDEHCGGTGGSYGSQGEVGDSGGSAPGPTYGNPGVLPLVGGSGGTGGTGGELGNGGGGGGGAILIASSTTITLNGQINADGGAGGISNQGWEDCGGGGSGGAMRLVADSIVGEGELRAIGGLGPGGYPYNNAGGSGGAGRIRVEANQLSLSDPGNPAYVEGLPTEPATLWPGVSAPTVRVTSIGGVAVPDDPQASFEFPYGDVALATPEAVTLTIEATNLPTTSTVTVRVAPRSGQDVIVPATFVSGDDQASIWEGAVQLSQGFAAIQVRAELPQP
jgi:hypothetical protein